MYAAPEGSSMLYGASAGARIAVSAIAIRMQAPTSAAGRRRISEPTEARCEPSCSSISGSNAGSPAVAAGLNALMRSRVDRA